jgi:hypothetical protein
LLFPFIDNAQLDPCAAATIPRSGVGSGMTCAAPSGAML